MAEDSESILGDITPHARFWDGVVVVSLCGAPIFVFLAAIAMVIKTRCGA